MKKLLVILIVLGAASGAYFYFNRPQSELVLTGVVTTNDVVVGPQIAGRLEQLLVSEGDAVVKG